MEMIVNAVMHTWNVLRGQILHVHTHTHTPPHTPTHRENYVEVIYKLFSLIVTIFSQCIHVSEHQVVHLKYTQLYVSIIF